MNWFGKNARYMDTDFLKKKNEHRYQNGVAATNIVNFVSVKKGFKSSAESSDLLQKDLV